MKYGKLRALGGAVDFQVMITVDLIKEIPVGNMLGEGIQWCVHDRSVWWTDILGVALYRFGWQSGEVERTALPEAITSFAFCDSDTDKILAAFASGFAFFNLKTQEVEWLHKMAFLPGEGRMNDGRVDRQGRFWCGTMMAYPGGETPPAGRLFCLDEAHTLTAHESSISISNGLCWSPDGAVMYFADSLPGLIYRYDFDTQSGAIANRKTFSTAPDGGSPDGAAVDAHGNVWSAQWGAGLVRVFNPDGSVIADIPTPASQPSCVAFGGDGLDLLFVTSAREGMTQKALEEDPSAGHVFVYQTNVCGLPEMQYQGSLT